MHDRKRVEVALAALAGGATLAGAAALAGVPKTTAWRWSVGCLPRSYTGRPWGVRTKSWTPRVSGLESECTRRRRGGHADAAQGPLARRRRVRGHFRRAQGLALPRQGLVGLDGGALHRQALRVCVRAFERCAEEGGRPACQIVISPIGRKLVNLVFDQRDRESNDEERSRFV